MSYSIVGRNKLVVEGAKGLDTLSASLELFILNNDLLSGQYQLTKAFNFRFLLRDYL